MKRNYGLKFTTKFCRNGFLDFSTNPGRMGRPFLACLVGVMLLASNLWGQEPLTSYLEVCKAQCVGHKPLSGNFTFTISEDFFQTGATVPVGGCSPSIPFPLPGDATIVETTVPGVGVSKIEAYGYDHVTHGTLPPDPVNRLISSDYVHRTADVSLVPGGVENETIAVFTNCKYGTGLLKICKVAGPGVNINDPYNFFVTGPDGDVSYVVPAGPPPGGYCTLAGAYEVETKVTVKEFPPDGFMVSDIKVNPPERGENKQGNSIDIDIEHGTTEVTYTNASEVSQVSACQPAGSLSTLLVSNNSVVAYVPYSNWAGRGPHAIGAVNIEGSYITDTKVDGLGDTINSCATDPGINPPQVLCTAQGPSEGNYSDNVYVFENVPNGNTHIPTFKYKVQTNASGDIGFSGGFCRNCGIAIDPINHYAVVGLTDHDNASGKNYPGFEFLALQGGKAPVPKPIWRSRAGQISEDYLIDATSKPPRLLSPAEGDDCVDPPNGICAPNYEIADLSYTGISGPTPTFQENQIFDKDSKLAPDSAAADCSIQVALSSLEPKINSNPSQVYAADITIANFDPKNHLWDTNGPPPQQTLYSLTSSDLTESGGHNVAGPIAVAQGGTHIGILSQEVGDRENGGNTITAFRLNLPPYSPSNPTFADWITCDLGPEVGDKFRQGFDPHTVTAYKSPGGHKWYKAGDAIAVLVNEADVNHLEDPPSMLAVVDLSRMLDTKYVKRLTSDPYTCADANDTNRGTLPTGPNGAVDFLPLPK
jgi:hypothetical protein